MLKNLFFNFFSKREYVFEPVPIVDGFPSESGKIESNEKVCYCDQSLLFIDPHMSDKEFDDLEKQIIQTTCAVCGKNPSGFLEKQ